MFDHDDNRVCSVSLSCTTCIPSSTSSRSSTRPARSRVDCRGGASMIVKSSSGAHTSRSSFKPCDCQSHTRRCSTACSAAAALRRESQDLGTRLLPGFTASVDLFVVVGVVTLVPSNNPRVVRDHFCSSLWCASQTDVRSRRRVRERIWTGTRGMRTLAHGCHHSTVKRCFVNGPEESCNRLRDE